ncbi:MAG TPA: TetR/AcrR family transcriptional regulator [Bacteroidales bacterium]|nr:TetR/AcrR family transcriptional regulator [Bacteroidales bacterium]
MSELIESEVRIIESAKQVFIEKGFEKTKMQDIAEKAGITRTNLNYYFRTKENLFFSIADQIFESLIPRVTPILDEKNSTPKEVVYKMVDVYCDFLQENRTVPFFIISEINRNPQLILEFISNNEKIQTYFEKIKSIVLPKKENFNGNPLFDKSAVELVPLIYGLVFSPYLLSPIVNEIYEGDEDEIDRFFESHRENLKIILSKVFA